MSTYRKWFKLVVWIGAIGNWTFAFWGLLIDPGALLTSLNLGTTESSTVWLFNYCVLLSILSCFYIPAAKDPFRYRANAWLLIIGRLLPATTFFVGVNVGFMPFGFLSLGTGDSCVGIIELVLLLLIIRAEREVSKNARQGA